MAWLMALTGLGAGSAIVWLSGVLSRPQTRRSAPAWWRLLFDRRHAVDWPGAIAEWSAALLFALLWMRAAPLWPLLVSLAGGAFFLLIALIDWRCRRVPDVLIYPALALVLLGQLLAPGGHILHALLGAAVAGGPFVLVALLKPGELGGGDVKLAVLIGLANGFPNVLWPLSVGILAGGLAAILLLSSRRGQLKTRIPYAPFLCLGAILALLYNPLALLIRR